MWPIFTFQTCASGCTKVFEDPGGPRQPRLAFHNRRLVEQKEVDRMTRISLGNLWHDNILKPALFQPLRKWHQIFSERRQDGTSRHQGWALRFGFFNKHTANSFTNNRVKIWNIRLNMKCYGSINQSVFYKRLYIPRKVYVNKITCLEHKEDIDTALSHW